MTETHITFEEFDRGDWRDKPTPEEFHTYQELQFSGVTNMFNVKLVGEITGLSMAKISYIMKHYSELERQYSAENEVY